MIPRFEVSCELFPTFNSLLPRVVLNTKSLQKMKSVKLPLQPLLALILFFLAFQGIAQEKYGGMTLYTVRDLMETQPRETLMKVADIGYKYIEATGYADGKFYGMEPAEFKSFLHSLGLEPISSHYGAVTLDNADEFIADAKAAGIKYFVIPIPPMGHFTYDAPTQTMNMSDDVKAVTEILNTIGKKCKEAGLELLYHNHDFEFKENENHIVPMDYFLQNTDPEYVNFQMDLFWTTKAGVDPVTYFERFPGRFKMWHVKDMDQQGRFAPVGTGTIDFARILREKDLSGMQYYIVEQDRTFDGMDPLQAIRISHVGIKEFGFQ